MNNSILRRIQLVRVALSSNPRGLLIGTLRGGIALSPEEYDEVLRPFIAFLQVCNGGSCGAIDFGSVDLLQDQHFIGHLPGGESAWFHIGQVVYAPLVISRTDGEVYLFSRDPEPEVPQVSLGAFDDFLLDYVFGEKYRLIVTGAEKDDDWYFLLQDLGFAPS